MATRWEVEKALLKSQLPSLARLLLLALLSKAAASDAAIPSDHTPSLGEIASMTGMSKSSVAEWLAVLEPAGWVTRVKPEGSGRYDRTQYRMGAGAEVAALPKRESRKPKPKPEKKDASSPLSGHLNPEGQAGARASEVASATAPSSPLSGQGGGPTEPARGPLSGTPGVRSANASGPLSGPTLISEPIQTVKPSSEQVEPTVNKPATVKPGWLAKNAKPKTARTATNTGAPRQPSLIAKTDVKLMEATQIVWDWLIAAGYDTFTPDDAKLIHQAVMRRYPGKTTPGYLRTMASNDSFLPFAEERRAGRAKEVEVLIAELETTKPPCEHGTLAGRETHPTHGTPLCPQCRRGLPPQRMAHRTHPDVVDALTAYRQCYAGPFDVEQLVNLTQQAEALRHGGASRDELIALAAVAAPQNLGFINAARKEAHV